MSHFPIGQQPPRSHSGPAHDTLWGADPARSRLRRRYRAPILAALGLIVALVAVVTLVKVGPDKNGHDSGVAEPAPSCGEPGTRELVEPGGAGSVFGFRMPRCFRPADDAVGFTETESNAVTLRTVIVPVEVVAEGDVIGALIIVSAGEFSSDMSSVSDAALEAQLWRDVDRVGMAFVSPRRRDVDGARGWRFTHVTRINESLIWVFVKHTSRIQVICRWTDPSLRARIAAGCDELVDTLTVT